MRKLVFVMLTSLFVMNVFAEKTYVNEINNEIDNSIMSEHESNLDSKADSLELKSIKFNRSQEINTSTGAKDLNSRKSKSSENQSQLKLENNLFDLDMPLSTSDAQPLLNLSLQHEETYEYDAYIERLRLNKKKKLDKIKVIGLYSAAIILNGIGDGLNNTHQKTMGHIFNAASIGVLLTTPFFIDYDTKKWYWYLLTYTSLRVTLFDAAYNVTTKQPIDFIGSTAITDKLYKMADFYGASKAMGLVVGLTIPFRIL